MRIPFGTGGPDRGFKVTNRLRLILASGLMLFLELALIRWLGANIVHLSYFTNFVLLGSFLGIGLGFLIARKSWSVLPWTSVLLAVLVLGVRAFPVSIDRAGSDVIYFTSLKTSGPPAWLVLPVVFLLTAAVLAGPAEAVGRCFAELEPLTAYRWDLIGSLMGIGLFTLLSFLSAPSVVWGVLVAVALLFLVRGARARSFAAVAAVCIVGALLVESTAAGVAWSPYYKITTRTDTSGGVKRVFISVNGVPHQSMSPASWKLTHSSAIYGAPYLHRDQAVPL